jgi:hypothetical protein
VEVVRVRHCFVPRTHNVIFRLAIQWPAGPCGQVRTRAWPPRELEKRAF